MKKVILILFTLCALWQQGFAQNYPGFIDFENGPMGPGHNHSSGNFENDPVDTNYFNSTYHVLFLSGDYDFANNVWNQDPELPKYSSVGAPDVAFKNTMNYSSCVMTNTEEDFPHAAPNPGCWFLTDNDGVVEYRPRDLKIDYDQNIIKSYSASASIYDLDGTTFPEGWKISLFTIDTVTGITSLDNSIYLTSVGATSGNWLSCVGASNNSCDPIPGGSYVIDTDNGDGVATEWTINSTSGNPIDFIILSYIGHGTNNLYGLTAKKVGVAFDNFFIFGADPPCDYTPDFSFTEDFSNPCLINFSDITSYPNLPGLEVLKVSWDFGDGTTGTGENVTHFYDSSATYTVCMTVWTVYNGECCKKTICKPVTTRDLICDPCDLMHSAVIVNPAGSPHTYMVGGIPSSLQNMFGYLWDFGDGTTGSGSTVNHAYEIPGYYEITLTVFYFDESTETCCSFTTGMFGDEGSLMPEGGTSESEENNDQFELNGEFENTGSQLIISPNPNNGEFILETENGAQIKSVKIFDNSGKLVYEEKTGNASGRHTIKLNGLNSGLYIIMINEGEDESQIVDKLLIK